MGIGPPNPFAGPLGDFSLVERFSLSGARHVVLRRRNPELGGGIFPGPGGLLWLATGFRIRRNGRLERAPATRVGMVAGADGAFYGPDDGAIERLTAAGRLQRFVYAPKAGTPAGAGAYLDSVAPGPDGNVWFTAYGDPNYFDPSKPFTFPDSVGRIDPTGHITLYPLPEGSSAPQAITAGPDGRMWIPVAQPQNPHIVRVAPEMPPRGWPAAARPQITRLHATRGGIVVSLRCRGIPGLFCSGRLTLTTTAGATAATSSPTVVLAARSYVNLKLTPHGLRSLTGHPARITAVFETRDFLGRHGKAILRRRLRIR